MQTPNMQPLTFEEPGIESLPGATHNLPTKHTALLCTPFMTQGALPVSPFQQHD